MDEINSSGKLRFFNEIIVYDFTLGHQGQCLRTDCHNEEQACQTGLQLEQLAVSGFDCYPLVSYQKLMYGAVWVHWENYGVLKIPGHLLGNSGTLFLLRSMIRNVGEVTSL